MCAYTSPYPTHGMFPVGVAVLIYVFISVGITFGLRAIVLPDDLVVYAFILVATILLVPFWPLFRHLAPTREKAR